jgi:hypothetical protein
MNGISNSCPEPICDVVAQIAALYDPAHPKDAVWLAAGNRVPATNGLTVLRLRAGTLLTTSAEKAARLMASPTDETLATILGYLESKRLVVGEPVVVQAVDPHGAVILEMGCSAGLLDRATDVASLYGTVRVTNLDAALRRRIRLAAVDHSRATA